MILLPETEIQLKVNCAHFYESNNLGAHTIIAFKPLTVEEVAKPLTDYGFHAPALSKRNVFPRRPSPGLRSLSPAPASEEHCPVAGTLMVEPTAGETKCEQMNFYPCSSVAIRG